jgi:hypothetical protein
MERPLELLSDAYIAIASGVTQAPDSRAADKGLIARAAANRRRIVVSPCSGCWLSTSYAAFATHI